MAVKRVRTVQMYFYSDGKHRHFKVWSAKDGGWYVDEVDETGETKWTIAHVDDMNGAECVMNKEVMAQ